MRKVLCLLVAFVLSSSVVFAQNDSSNNSTVETKSFFDSIIKKKSVSIEYRHYLNSKVNDKDEFAGFKGNPQLRLDGKADLFDGVLVGGIYVQTTFIDSVIVTKDKDTDTAAGLVDVVEFSLTSPYTSLESSYFDASATLSWTPSLLNKYGFQYESINGKVEATVKAPSFDLGIGSLALSSGVEFVTHFVPFNRDPSKGTTARRGFYVNGIPEVQKTQKPNLDLTVTVLEAKLPLKSVSGLVLGLKSEFEANYFAGINDEGDSKYSKIDRETRTSVSVGYALTPSLVVSNTLVYNMDGFYKDSRAGKKWTDVIGVKYSL